VILEEEAKAQKEGRKVELVSKPYYLDEIDSNNWYSSENRSEREQKPDTGEESRNANDIDHRFENENVVNWYWFCKNNSLIYTDETGFWVVAVSYGWSGGFIVGPHWGGTIVVDGNGQVKLFAYLGGHIESNAGFGGEIEVAASLQMPSVEDWAGFGFAGSFTAGEGAAVGG
jgi:hypothetical protein